MYGNRWITIVWCLENLYNTDQFEIEFVDQLEKSGYEVHELTAISRGGARTPRGRQRQDSRVERAGTKAREGVGDEARRHKEPA